jgi:acyl-CoA synthetase (AMP-forming)/AMP-acid ligase II
METVAHALSKALATRDDRTFMYARDGARITVSGLRELVNLFRGRSAGNGLRAGDVILLEFPAASWPLFAAGYIGAHLEGLVPVLVAAGTGTDRRDAASRELPVRAVCGPSGTGFDLTVTRADHEPAREGVAEYLLTSGTTGLPKVVAVGHAARLAVRQRTGEAGITAIAIPPGSNASQTVLAEALLNGGGLAYLERWSPADFLDLVETSRAKVALLAPAMAASLIRHPAFRAGSLSSLVTLRLGMAPTSRELIKSLAKALPGMAISNIYTTTEAWPAGTVMRYSRDDAASVGRPLPGTLVRVVDAAGHPVAANVAGRVQLAWEPAATAGMTWIGTGDVGYLTPDNALFLYGRENEIITRGGSVVSLAEVEAAMLGSGLVLDAAAYRAEHAMGGELLGAAVVWAGDMDEDSLRRRVRERLGSAAVPTVISGVPAIPRDHQGKLNRALVQPATAPAAASEDPVLTGIREIWAEIFARADFVGTDDFFMIGGDSLAAAMCNTLLEERLGVLLPLQLHYEATTLDQLAETVRTHMSPSDGYDAAASLQIPGPRRQG